MPAETSHCAPASASAPPCVGVSSASVSSCEAPLAPRFSSCGAWLGAPSSSVSASPRSVGLFRGCASGGIRYLPPPGFFCPLLLSPLRFFRVVCHLGFPERSKRGFLQAPLGPVCSFVPGRRCWPARLRALGEPAKFRVAPKSRSPTLCLLLSRCLPAARSAGREAERPLLRHSAPCRWLAAAAGALRRCASALPPAAYFRWS